MSKNIALVLLGAVLATILLKRGELAPPVEDVVEAPIGIDEDDRRVSDEELEVYIDVYRTMQSDHGLTIEDVTGEKNLTLEEFRSLERRVQNNSAYVERVREALLEHVQRNSRFSEPARPTPPAASSGQGEDSQP
jgi:hypothetical protein